MRSGCPAYTRAGFDRFGDLVTQVVSLDALGEQFERFGDLGSQFERFGELGAPIERFGELPSGVPQCPFSA